jgi:tetratricopeptide (TPR) repeat protein
MKIPSRFSCQRTHALQFLLFIILISFVSKAWSQSKPTAEYNSLIQQADNALSARDYPTSLMLYEKAGRVNPEQKYTSSKINGIRTLLDSSDNLRSTLFENLIVSAETYFKAKDYAKAKTEYQKALSIDPSSQFPKDRLSQISALYADPSDQAYYADAIASGDKALAAGEFDKAVQSYQTALAVKPGDKTCRDKIQTAQKLKTESAARKAEADKLISGADKLLQAGKRAEAKTEYQKVLALIPGQAYAAQKISEIDAFDSQRQSVQAAYDKAIEQADQFYISRDFANARIRYEEALKVKPEARYPKEMLEKTKSGANVLQSEQEKYDGILAGADAFFKSGDYESALLGYRSALALRPSETYPATKVTDIEKIIGERTSREEAFVTAIKNGDQSFGEKKYDLALAQYRNALSLKPTEAYPDQKIKEINALLGEQKASQEAYNKVISDGDLAFKARKFDEAIAAYSRSLDLRPGEEYPTRKIAEARAQIGAAQEKEASYASSVKEGDSLMALQSYNAALAAFGKALEIKPSEKYPKQKTDEINTILSKLKSDSDKYQMAVSAGDRAFAAGNLTQAAASFTEALKYRPEEQYPKTKLDEIAAATAARKKTDEDYQASLLTGRLQQNSTNRQEQHTSRPLPSNPQRNTRPIRL